jgi:Na+-transporting NADH:ubiquinone oxidoreductase subunit NqrC
MHKKLNKMNLSNPTVIVVVVILLLLSSTVVIFFPMISEQQQQQQQDKPGSVLKLAKANVSIDIPISKGYIDGNIAYFVATDASDKHAVSSITNNTGFPINYAPLLNNISESIRGQGYVFLNGMQGEAPGGFQLPVANAAPGDKDQSIMADKLCKME